jgi:peptidoglycan hydrolase-like protein with peptidoglycan-binding domain
VRAGMATMQRGGPVDGRPGGGTRRITAARRRPSSAVRARRVLIGLVVVVGASCGDDDTEPSDTAPTEVVAVATTTADDVVAAAQARVTDAEQAVDAAQEGLATTRERFCADVDHYVEALDRYGKLFTDDAATVGDVQTLGADLDAPRDAVALAIDDVEAAKAALATAEQELIDSQAALTAAIATASSVPTSSTEPAATTSTTIVPPATIERVQQAEEELADAAAGITPATPLADASAEYNSAALALQIAWLTVLRDAGCLADDQLARAVEQVTAYTVGVQTQLQQAGYYDGAIDGLYGPNTVAGVKQLQAENGLPETGFVDRATARALDDELEQRGQQAAATQAAQTAALQTVLTLAGYWRGPVDGIWTEELTDALIAFQTALGVTPTGSVDAATLAAFEQALTAPRPAPAPPTTLAPPPAATPTAPPTSPPPATASPTSSSSPGSTPS